MLPADASGQDYVPVPCVTIDSLEMFWRVFQNIKGPAQMGVGTTYLMFRAGVQPKWEDDANRDGGSYDIRFSAGYSGTQQFWEKFAARAVAECWSNGKAAAAPPLHTAAGYVTGVVLKVREKHDTLQVWVSGVSAAVDEALRQDLRGCPCKMEYVKHSEAQGFHTHLTAAVPSKPSKSPTAKKSSPFPSGSRSLGH